jgi:hypothetical protein
MRSVACACTADTPHHIVVAMRNGRLPHDVEWSVRFAVDLRSMEAALH